MAMAICLAGQKKMFVPDWKQFALCIPVAIQGCSHAQLLRPPVVTQWVCCSLSRTNSHANSETSPAMPNLSSQMPLQSSALHLLEQQGLWFASGEPGRRCAGDEANHKRYKQHPKISYGNSMQSLPSLAPVMYLSPLA